MTNQDPRSPIGAFQYKGPFSPAERSALIDRIEALPPRLRSVAEQLSAAQTDKSYREGGWTARQLVHHIADGHMHLYLRFRYALAVDGARIESFPENPWAESVDSRQAPLSYSLDLIEPLHRRWVYVLRHMSAADFARAFNHSDNGLTPLDKALAYGAWHGDHHTAQIKFVLETVAG